jgi:hypothetical protein
MGEESMKTFTKTGLALVIGVASLASFLAAQVPSRLNDKEVESLIKRLEENADRFRKSYDHALNRNRFNSSEKNQAKQYVKDFESATDHLKDHFSKRNSAAGDVEEVLNHAAQIDEFMTRNALESDAQSDWMNLRASLDELARAYNVSWSWDRSNRASQINHNSQMHSEHTQSLLDRIQRDSDRFRESLHIALESDRFDEARSEERIYQLVGDLAAAIKQLQIRSRENDLTPSEVDEALRLATRVDGFMIHNVSDSHAQNDWTALHEDFNQLARVYGIAWTK